MIRSYILYLNTGPDEVALKNTAALSTFKPKNKFLMQISSDILPVTVPLYLFSFVNSKKTGDGTIHGYQK